MRLQWERHEWHVEFLSWRLRKMPVLLVSDAIFFADKAREGVKLNAGL